MSSAIIADEQAVTTSATKSNSNSDSTDEKVKGTMRVARRERDDRLRLRFSRELKSSGIFPTSDPIDFGSISYSYLYSFSCSNWFCCCLYFEWLQFPP